MPYLAIENFARGMDRRRQRVAGEPGALWTLKNGHITRGGDIERSKRFVNSHTLPSGTFSLAALRSQLYSFGSGDLSSSMPLGIQYQRLEAGHATGTLTITSGNNAVDTETLVIGSKTYTFQATLTDVDGNIHIGADRDATLTNLANAINGSGGSAGTDYATSNTAHTLVTAVANGDGTMTVTSILEGVVGNAYATTEAMTNGSWGATVMSGGGGVAVTRILDVKTFAGAFYAVAEFEDGNVFHYYNGARVTDWDGLVTPTTDSVAEALAAKINRDSAVSAKAYGAVVEITARTAGTAFTISASATDGGGGADTSEDLTAASVQANVAAVAETLATADIEITGGTNDPGTNTVNSITVDGTEILSAVVDWAGSNAATAIRVATEINNGSALHGYTAAVVSATVTISAAVGTGDSVNGDAVVVTTTGDVTDTSDSTVSGGVDAVTAVAQVNKVTVSGTIETLDTFTVTINGTDYKVTGLASGMGTSAYVDKQRVWSTAGRLWRYCKLGDATVWDPNAAGSDAGHIDLTETTEGTDVFAIATRYQNLAAVMSASFTVLYSLDVDPDLIAVTDTLDNTGTDVPHSVIRYGNNDVFFLDATGIRSLRARDSSNAPFISDVGNAIDTFVRETLDALTEQERVDAVGAIEPVDGRFWLAAGGTIFVLSFFPADKISAWSYYQPDEFDSASVDAMVRSGKRMYVRAGNEVYLYGGADGDTWPAASESACTVKMPFLSASDPAGFKAWTGFDIACVNEWAVVFAYDPNNEARTIEVGRLTESTFNEMNTALAGQAGMVAVELTCSDAGEASISMVNLHYEKIRP